MKAVRHTLLYSKRNPIGQSTKDFAKYRTKKKEHFEIPQVRKCGKKNSVLFALFH
jgi:hypothetical protein